MKDQLQNFASILKRQSNTYYPKAARTTKLLLKTIHLLLVAAWKWIDKPHTIRIRKKTIIIGCVAALVLYSAWPSQPAKIVYAEPRPIAPTPVYLRPIPEKRATLPESDFKAVSGLDPVEIPKTPSQAPKTQSSTNNLANSVVSGCGDNAYANYIYMHESGCNLFSVNTKSGACGIGQAWPCSKLLAVCSLSDYACQNQFFTEYANGMGGWAAAYSIWISKGWW